MRKTNTAYEHGNSTYRCVWTARSSFAILYLYYESIAIVGLNAITKEAWNTAQNTEDKREKIQVLSLAKECYSMK